MFSPSLYQDHRKLHLLTQMGVRRVSCDGNQITGQFLANLHDYAGETGGRLVEKFVNWSSDPDSIIAFTREYGPLHIPAVERGAFSFPLAEFRESQAYCRSIWEEAALRTGLELPDGRLRLVGGTVTYTASDLFKYLLCDLLTSDPARVRVCKRVGCSHPYFIAAHQQKQFCSTECQDEGHRSAKRDWWQKNGKDWVQSRKTKGEDDGSNKAR